MCKDLAEHAERAMREDGLLPRWQLEPIHREATLRLDNGLAVRVVEDPFAPRVNITLEHHGRTHGMALDVALRFLPRYLPPILEAAAAELRRLDMQSRGGHHQVSEVRKSKKEATRSAAGGRSESAEKGTAAS